MERNVEFALGKLPQYLLSLIYKCKWKEIQLCFNFCIKLLLKLLYKCQSSFTYEYIIHMKLLKVLNAKYVSSKKGIKPSMI